MQRVVGFSKIILTFSIRYYDLVLDGNGTQNKFATMTLLIRYYDAVLDPHPLLELNAQN